VAGGAGSSGATSSGGAGAAGTSGAAGAAGAAETLPPYPIVLCHGFFGFQDFAGVNFITYFYEVKDHLASQGETDVFTPAVDPFNDSTARGADLYAQVQMILAQTGASKVNLIGHSQGGLDARVVAHDHPEVVASVTTIATPHGGTPVADVALKIDSDPNEQALVDDLVKLVGIPLYDAAGNTTSLAKSLEQMSTPGMKAFNAQYTDAPGIPYQSFAGRSNLSLAQPDCDVAYEQPFLSPFDMTLDPVNALLSVPAAICNGAQIPAAPNDGLIRVADAKWGTFRGCMPADHFDEIGQLLGASPGAGNDWAYLDFYSQLVKLIRSQGY
jgi:triacylglycerol lipase